MAEIKKKSKFFETKNFGLIIGLVIFFLVLLVWLHTDIINRMEIKILDLHFSLKQVLYSESSNEGVTERKENINISPDIQLIGIEENTLAKIGAWPFPRSVHGTFLDRLARIKDQTKRERSVFLDLFFIEPKNTTPIDDAILINSIAENERVFLETVLSLQEPSEGSRQEVYDRMTILSEKHNGEFSNVKGPWQAMFGFPGAEPPLKPYGRATAAYGHANYLPDFDETFRRQKLVAKFSEQIEVLYLHELSVHTEVDEDNYERLEWQDKLGRRHNIKLPLTEYTLSNLRSRMTEEAPPLTLDTDGDGQQDADYYKIVRYKDHFVPSITLSLAMDYLNVEAEDVEVVLGSHILLRNVTSYESETDSWQPYQRKIKKAIPYYYGDPLPPGLGQLYYEDGTKYTDDIIPFPREEEKVESIEDKGTEQVTPVLLYDENGQLVPLTRMIKEEAEYRVISELSIPINKEGEMLINFMGKRSSVQGQVQTFPVRPYLGYVANPAPTDPNRYPPHLGVDNKILMLGAFALGLADDEKPTPFGMMYGVEIHANALNTILMDNFIRPISPYIDWIIAAALVMLIAIVTSRLKIFWGFAVTLIMVILLFFWCNFGFELYNTIYSFSPGALGMLFCFITIVVYRLMTEEKDKQRIKAMFGKYVSPQVVDSIIDEPLELGGTDRELTVFFSDIRGFTTLSESMTPQELVNHLNVYLTAMTDIIMEFNGTLDKYVGDEIMCFWGAPLPQEEHAILACKCALKQMRVLKELNESWPPEKRIDIGIGVNSGIMTVGNMGSLGRMNYTLMGDNVNLGARLEGTNKQYHTHIIISEYTYGLVKDRIIARELDNIRVKGKNKPVLIYELIDVLE